MSERECFWVGIMKSGAKQMKKFNEYLITPWEVCTWILYEYFSCSVLSLVSNRWWGEDPCKLTTTHNRINLLLKRRRIRDAKSCPEVFFFGERSSSTPWRRIERHRFLILIEEKRLHESWEMAEYIVGLSIEFNLLLASNSLHERRNERTENFYFPWKVSETFFCLM